MARITGDFDGLMDDFKKQLLEGTEEAMAEEIVAAVRENDLASADQVEVTIDDEARELGVDPVRVIALANRMLGL